MSSLESNEIKRVLYLEQIDIETSTKNEPRIELRIDGKDVEIQQKKRTLTWIPFRSLELLDESKITLVIKAGIFSLRKQETQMEFSGQEVMEAFWGSTNSISREVTFDERLATITFKVHSSPTLETLRKVVQKLESAMGNYRVLMSDSNEHQIDLVFKSGTNLADINPIVGVAFDIASRVFEVLKEQKKYDDMVWELAEWTARILPFATLFLEEIVCDETELLDRAVRKMCTLVADTAKFICDYAKQNPSDKAVKSVAKDARAKVTAFQGEIVKLKEDFDNAVNVETLKLVRKAEEQRLQDQLRPISEPSHHKGQSCMEGTRIAILNDILAWSAKAPKAYAAPNAYNTDSVFWLYGIPGLGKTYVANSLCHLLREKGNLGGSFFCRRDDPIRGEPTRVLPNLIHRLAATWSPYRKLVAQELRDQVDFSPNSPDSDRLFRRLQWVQEHPPRVLVLVIDAFDECGDSRARERLLDTLLEVCCDLRWLKLVIISRKEYDITKSLDKRGIAGRDLGAEHHASEDIRRFTKNRMASIATERHLPDDWPSEGRLEQIVERSGDLFIFVNTVCLLLDDPDPESALVLVLSEKSKGANTDLYDLYLKILTPRVGRNKEIFKSFARAMIVVAKYCPLSDTTLASLTGLDPPIIRSLLDRLSSLLYQDGSKAGGIRVRHLSVLEFLTGSACPSEFRVDLHQANAELNLRCLATMVKGLKFNICKLETSSVLHALDQPFVLGFRPSKHRGFREVLSLMGKVPVAIAALRRIKGFVNKFQARHREAVDDVLRFLLAFTTPISTSTPHIYISALRFMPTESRLWKNASESFPKITNVCKGRMQSWPNLPSVWQGHASAVFSLAYSPDGQYVASGSPDKTIRIWDAETGDTVGEPLRGHTGPVLSVAYSPDGRRIVSGSSAIQIWDAETGEAVGEPSLGHTGFICTVAYSPDGRRIVSGSLDKTIRIWNAETGEAVGGPLREHTGTILSVVYSPDGRRFVSSSLDNTIRIWDSETGEVVGEPLKGHTSPVHSVTYSPDSQHVVSGSSDNTIGMWNAETGEAVGELLRGHTSSIRSVAYSPDGCRIVSSSSDKTIRIWDVETGEVVGEPWRGHNGCVFRVAYSPDGQRVVSGSSDKTIRIWDSETGEPVGELSSGYNGDVYSVAYSPDGRRVVSGSKDNMIRIWDSETGDAVDHPFMGHVDSIRSVAYSPDGRRVVSGSYDTTIRIWDTETGEAVVVPLRRHTGSIYSVKYSPNGRHVVSGSSDNTIRMWDAETGEAVGKPLRGHTGSIYSVAYSPDGRRIVSGFSDKTIQFWDAETGEVVGQPFKGHDNEINSVAYSPDGRGVVSVSDDRTIRMWDTETREAVGESLRGHTGSICSVAYSPGGRHIVSSSSDETIRMWDAETREAVGEPFSGHTSYIWSISYSPDGRHVVSGSDDGTIRLWETETGAKNDDQCVATDFSNFPTTIGAKPNYPSIIQSFASASPGHINPPMMLHSDGYVRSAEGPLFWVPEDCRNGIISPAIMTIPTTGRERAVRVDLTNFQYGTSWTNVYAGA